MALGRGALKCSAQDGWRSKNDWNSVLNRWCRLVPSQLVARTSCVGPSRCCGVDGYVSWRLLTVTVSSVSTRVVFWRRRGGSSGFRQADRLQRYESP